MKLLKTILKDFCSNRSDYLKNHDWGLLSEDERAFAVSGWARPVAEKMIFGGYLQVADLYRVRIDTLELYYHEEVNDGLKDPIMYHTDDRRPKYLRKDEKGRHESLAKATSVDSYPYFEFGSFHLHTSGVDIAFEEPETYRASFLIREFTVESIDGTASFSDECSTHIFDFLFPYGISSESLALIEWVPKGETGEAYVAGRKNVYQYEKKDGEYVKAGLTGFKKKEPGNIECTRPWQFSRYKKPTTSKDSR